MQLNVTLKKNTLVKDIVHVNAIISFAAVPLEVKFTKLLFLIWHDELMFKLALLPLRKGDTILSLRQERDDLLQLFQHELAYIDKSRKITQELQYLDTPTLKEILADVSTIVFNRVLVDKLLAHNWPFLLKTGRIFSLL